MTFVSYAQNFEDVMLWRALRHVESGFYIDVGAGHPDDFSVTRAFYDRGWSGINVEPTSRITRLAGARLRDVNIHAAVGRRADKLTLFVVEDAKDISTLDPVIAEAHRAAGFTISESQVPVVTLADICREHAKAEVNFLKVDVEGAERDVLLGADFEHFRPWIVVVEATAPLGQNPTHLDWEELLTVANYRFAWFDGLNRFYIAGEHWGGLSPAFAVQPNVFDDFIRALDTDHLTKIVGAEARAGEANGRAAQYEARAVQADAQTQAAEGRAQAAEGRAQAAEGRAQAAEARAEAAERSAQAAEARAQAAEGSARAAEARAQAAEGSAQAAEARAQAAAGSAQAAHARAVEATVRAGQAEERAAQATTLAQEAEKRAVWAEENRAEIAAREAAALGWLEVMRESTSWRVTAPMRMARWLVRAKVGAALIEAGIAQERVEHLKSLAGTDGGVAGRALRIAVHMVRKPALLNRVATLCRPQLRLTDRSYPVSAPASTIPQTTSTDSNCTPVPALNSVAGATCSPSYRTRTVHQFHSGSALGDAITNAMFVMQRWLRALGYESDIFVEHRHPQLADRLFVIDDLPMHGDYVLIVHHSMGYDACERIAALPARKVLVYHNITPAEFLGDFPEAIPYAELGRRQLSLLRPHMAAALADSEFNALELRANGYDAPVACPFLFDVEQLIANAAHGGERPDGTPFTVLFVGRVVASKGQAELVDAFAEFRRGWPTPCRLVLVGRMASPDALYPSEVRRRVDQQNLEDAVLVTGSVSDSKLSEWYRDADLFVSLSLHEGFGVPLVEAMAHGIPVLAWPAGAVPYTLGGGGELLTDRSPTGVAAAMARIAGNLELRAQIVAGQRKVLERFRLDRQVPHLIQALVRAGAAAPLQQAPRQALLANLRFTVTGHLSGTYSLAAINRWVALSLEHRYQGTVRLVPWENGPVAELSQIPAGVTASVATLVSRQAHLTGPEVVISQHYPVYVPTHGGDLTAAMVFWEESLLPPDTISTLNSGFDAVFAPSTHVADALINSGLSIPVRIVGLAPDLAAFHRIGAERGALGVRTGRTFTFLHVSSCFPRKGVDVLLAAYAHAFCKSDPVRLVIKGFPNPHNDVPDQIERLLERDPDVAEIIMINSDLDDTGLHQLYRDADAMVLPTRGEGFNLPAAEAMASGIPLIVTDHGGHRDFCTGDDAQLVRSGFAPSRSHLASAGSVWAEPDADDLAAALRWTFDDITQGGGICAARAGRARDLIAERLDRDAWAKRMSETAVELLTRPRPRPLRVAWVSTWAVHCGIAEYSRLLVEHLPRHPDRVGPAIVVLCDQRTAASTDSDEIRVRPSWRLGDWTSMERLAQVVSTEDPDVVVVQYHRGLLPWDSLATLLADRRVSGRVTVVTLHAAQHLLDIGPDQRAVVIAALSHASRVLVHRIADVELLKTVGLGRNVTLFPHGAQQPNGTPLVRALTERAAPILGCHGFFLPGKGISRLIETAANLRRTWPHLRLRLLNAEYPVPDSAAEIARCRALAESLGLSDAIEWETSFLPPDECVRILSECDLLVLPYDHTEESASGALRRALASGVPTAVTAISIFEEADDAVYRFAGLDVQSMTAGIDALLRDTQARNCLQQSACAWLAACDWGIVAERMFGMLTGLRVAGLRYSESQGTESRGVRETGSDSGISWMLPGETS